jgi:hypothetical protein
MKAKAISIYSGLTDEGLNHLLSQYTDRYGKALFDKTRPLNERKLSKLIAEFVSPDKQEQERFSVCECVKEYLYRKAAEIAKLVYLSMEKRKDFGIPGKQRITIPFCRSILNIPDDCEVTQFDAYLFRSILIECDRRNGYKSGDEYLEYVKNYALDILGKKFPITDTDLFDELYELLGANWYFWATLSLPYGARFILGELDKREIEHNKILLILDEYIHSPQLYSSLAAEVFRDTTIIRQEALNVIFFNKWQKYFDESKAERYHALLHPNSAFRDGIKNIALSLYGASNTKDVLEIKDIFLQEMLDGVIWHEMGHHVAYKDYKPEHYDFHYAIVNNENSGSVLMESVADWAPQNGNRKGAFTRFLELAQEDPKRATRDIYVYMSDCWFPDEEEYMSLYSDVLVGLTLYFINQDGSVDFARLAAEKDQIYAFLQERFRNLVEQLIAVIRQSEYDYTIKKLNFSEIEQKELKMHQESGKPKSSLEELRKSDSYWENMIGYLEKFSKKSGWVQYQNIINEENKMLQQEVLKIVAKGNDKKYKSLREYIFDRAREIGIIEKLLEMDSSLMMRRICKRNATVKKSARKEGTIGAW